jgi:hypothetical protein
MSQKDRCETIEYNGKAHRRCTRLKHNGGDHAFSKWSLTEPTKTTQRRAYVAVIDPSGKHKLGIAEEGEPGFYPFPDDHDLGGSYKDRAHALATAEECNKRLGLTPEEALAIVASSYGASMRMP